MSRKSAYALKARDPVFAAAWIAASGASGRRSANTAAKQPDGDTRTRTASSSGPTANRLEPICAAAEERDRFFARLAANLGRPAQHTGCGIAANDSGTLLIPTFLCLFCRLINFLLGLRLAMIQSFAPGLTRFGRIFAGVGI